MNASQGFSERCCRFGQVTGYPLRLGELGRKGFASCSPLLLTSHGGPSLDSVALRVCYRRRSHIRLHFLRGPETERQRCAHRSSRNALLHHSEYLSLYERTRHGRALCTSGRTPEAARRCSQRDDGFDAKNGDSAAISLCTGRHQSGHEYRQSGGRRRGGAHSYAYFAALARGCEFCERHWGDADLAGDARGDLGEDQESTCDWQFGTGHLKAQHQGRRYNLLPRSVWFWLVLISPSKLQIKNHLVRTCSHFNSRPKKSSAAPYARIQLFHSKNP